jgi:two-component system phosphate regulon sensor histidine kinase PhoR
MWLLPGLKVGVSPRGQSVSQLINNRTKIHLYAACLIVTLLVFGFLLILRNLRKEMRLAQAKSDFASNVSHELRTPLALISMFAETLLLERYKSPEKRKEYESIIVKESSRLTNIINKILNFSQMEANKRKYQLAPVQANAIVEELMGDYSYHLDSHGFTYQIKLAKEPTDMLGDKEAIYEALVNLVDNAMKYSPDRKEIHLETHVSGDHIHITVRDHGIGIDPKQTRHIFEKFYRVTQGNIQTTRGAGLGLALVKTIVEAHDGEVSVQSEPGKGSTFTLTFKKNNP